MQCFKRGAAIGADKGGVIARGDGRADHFSLSAVRQLLTLCPSEHLINADSQMPNLMKRRDEGLAGITSALTGITLAP